MKFWNKVTVAFSDKFIRDKIIFVLLMIVAFRLLSSVPLPGIDTVTLESFLQNNQFLNLVNLFSGGGLKAISIIMLGVGPYITASIIMQLMTVISPRLKEIYHHEGEIGRKKFAAYSRYLTVPIAIIQGFSILYLLVSQGVIPAMSVTDKAVYILIITAGAMLITWLGEMITEFGIGNGVSIIIFSGIVASLPTHLQQAIFLYDPSQLITYIVFAVIAFLIILGIIYISEAERPVPVTYSKSSRGGESYGSVNTYVPLRINQAGVMPIIFALSILLFPRVIVGLLAKTTSHFWQSVSSVLSGFLNTAWLYSLVYFVLVVAFTYFYTAITFEPDTMAENLQKGGAFVPGIRPGQKTSEYISHIVTRITFVGAIFLGLIAVIPIIMQSTTGNQAFAIGGTSVLIVVSVVMDLFKKIDSQVSMRSY